MNWLSSANSSIRGRNAGSERSGKKTPSAASHESPPIEKKFWISVWRSVRSNPQGSGSVQSIWGAAGFCRCPTLIDRGPLIWRPRGFVGSCGMYPIHVDDLPSDISRHKASSKNLIICTCALSVPNHYICGGCPDWVLLWHVSSIFVIKALVGVAVFWAFSGPFLTRRGLTQKSST